MKKILLVLILVLTISLFTTNAQGISLGYFLKVPDEIPEWQQPLKTRRSAFKRYTFLIIPLGSDNTTLLCLTMTYIAFCRMYPDATPPPEFSKFFEVKTKDESPGDFGRSILSSILLTMAFQEGYWIEETTDNYIVLKKFIYKKEQKQKSNKAPNQTSTLSPEKGLEYYKVAASVEGSSDRAEADAEEWHYLCDDPEVVKDILDKNEYYQRHRFGRKYLEALLEQARMTERQRADPVFIIDKKGERYFVYKYIRKWQH